MSAIQTAGDLRGFLADVLIGIREKRIKAEDATAIAKVAAEINRSLVVEIQTAIQSGVKQPVPGSMVIATAQEKTGISDVIPATQQAKIITEIIPAEKVEPIAKPKPAIAIAPIPKRDDDKVWCDQCDISHCRQAHPRPFDRLADPRHPERDCREILK